MAELPALCELLWQRCMACWRVNWPWQCCRSGSIGVTTDPLQFMAPGYAACGAWSAVSGQASAARRPGFNSSFRKGCAASVSRHLQEKEQMPRQS